jgi:hypothetical protein
MVSGLTQMLLHRGGDLAAVFAIGGSDRGIACQVHEPTALCVLADDAGVQACRCSRDHALKEVEQLFVSAGLLDSVPLRQVLDDDDRVRSTMARVRRQDGPVDDLMPRQEEVLRPQKGSDLGDGLRIEQARA